jgi:hypothetical protein
LCYYIYECVRARIGYTGYIPAPDCGKTTAELDVADFLVACFAYIHKSDLIPQAHHYRYASLLCTDILIQVYATYPATCKRFELRECRCEFGESVEVEGVAAEHAYLAHCGQQEHLLDSCSGYMLVDRRLEAHSRYVRRSIVGRRRVRWYAEVVEDFAGGGAYVEVLFCIPDKTSALMLHEDTGL